MDWYFFSAWSNVLILPICADDIVQGENDLICMEDRMRTLGILNSKKDCASNFDLKGVDLETAIPKKKVSYDL